MKKILFFLILFPSLVFAQVKPIPFRSPVDIYSGIYWNHYIKNSVDTLTHGYGVPANHNYYFINSNATGDIIFRVNGVDYRASDIGSGGGVYTAGTGLTLTSGTQFSHTAHTGDAAGATSLTVVALQGYGIATTSPTSGNVLSWNGTNWTPSAPTGTSYAAGTGITITSNTISLTSPVAVNLGGTGQTSYTNGQILIGNSSGNTLSLGTLTAGNGITVTNGAGTITVAKKYYDSNEIVRYWSDTFSVTRVDTNTISFYVSSSSKASQLQNSLVNHIIRWKNGTTTPDSTKVAMVNMISASGTKVTITLLGNYFLSTDRTTSVAYTLYHEAKMIDWYASGEQNQSDSAVGKKYKLPTTGVTYRIIGGKVDVVFPATGATASFIPSVFWAYGVGNQIFTSANMTTNTSRQLRVANAYRTITGADKYWITFRTRTCSGTNVASDVNLKMFYCEYQLLSAQ